MDIHISDHAVSRWNSRVGPSVNKEELQYIMNLDFITPTIKKWDNTFIFTFFHDIVALAEKIENSSSYIIVTFLGRKSLTFYLNSVPDVLYYRKSTNNMDGVLLKVDPEKISKQKLPDLLFNLSKKDMKMDYYNHEKHKSICYHISDQIKIKIKIYKNADVHLLKLSNSKNKCEISFSLPNNEIEEYQAITFLLETIKSYLESADKICRKSLSSWVYDEYQISYLERD